jgi:hypothetical protein
MKGEDILLLIPLILILSFQSSPFRYLYCFLRSMPSSSLWYLNFDWLTLRHRPVFSIESFFHDWHADLDVSIPFPFKDCFNQRSRMESIITDLWSQIHEDATIDWKIWISSVESHHWFMDHVSILGAYSKTSSGLPYVSMIEEKN